MSFSLTFCRILIIGSLLSIGLSACGRRGALEPPPNGSAAAQPEQGATDQATLPSPVGTPRSTPRRGYTIPDKPFILDPLL